MVAVGARVGDHVEGDGGEGAVGLRAEPHAHLHRMAGGGCGELLLAGHLPDHGAPELQHGERDEVFRQHLLLAAEAAPDPAADHAHPLAREIVEGAERVAGQEGHLRRGADDEAARRIDQAERRMRLEMAVLHPLRDIDALVDRLGFREPRLHVADRAVRLGGEVRVAVERWRIGARARGRPVGGVVDEGGAGAERRLRIEHGGADLVRDGDAGERRLGRGLGLRHHRGDALAGEADDGVEHAGIGGIVPRVVVAAGGEQGVRRIRMGEHRDDARERQRRFRVDPEDAGGGVRRAQHLHVEEPRHREVEGEGGASRDDRLTRRRRDVAPDGIACPGPHPDDPVDRVADGAVAGAAAEIALERVAEIRPPALVEGGGRHHHPGRAEAALEALRGEEGRLHGVEILRHLRARSAGAGEPLHRGDAAPRRPEGRGDAGMDRLAVEMDGAGAAIARVAALLDAKPPEVAQQGAQALAGAGGKRLVLPVDGKAHQTPSPGAA